jgi:outer membrane protein OmpA-like peptidoglycan-associated protein
VRFFLVCLLAALFFGCQGHSGPQGPTDVRALEPVPLAWETLPDVPRDGAATTDAPPLALTASDGTGLRLAALHARASIEGPLAFTELTLQFVNPTPRRVEGTFSITLPPTAIVNRFAMRQEAGWQEGEVVELQAARAAYETFLHQRVDPALLENQAGNRFQARVFPIQPGEYKSIIVSYVEEVSRADAPYRLYLRGLPTLDKLDVELLAPMQSRAVAVHKAQFAPDRDFVYALPRASDRVESDEAFRHEGLAILRVTPLAAAAPPEPIAGLTILVDTSASRAPGFAEEVARVGQVVSEIRRTSRSEVPLRVACFDQDVEEIFSGPASRFGETELTRIAGREPLGATDLAGALRWAATHPEHRLLLVTDGTATMGETGQAEISALAARLEEVGVERIDALAVGSARDESLLSAIVTSSRKRRGVVAEATDPAERIVQMLTGGVRSHVKLAVPGSTFSFPTEVPAVQRGDQLLVYAEVPPDRPLAIEVDGVRRSLPSKAAPSALLETAFARARIQRLAREWHARAVADEQGDALRRQIVELSTRHRVLSEFTGMLVLETEDDYARFGIDRHALRDVLVVGPRGVEPMRRRDAVFGQPEDRGSGEIPEGDRDSDDVLDPNDKCPDVPEDRDGIDDNDGCPEDDADHDGVPDNVDVCPKVPGTFNPDQKFNGCPQDLMGGGGGQLVVLTHVRFQASSATILPESIPMLTEVAQILRDNPLIRKMRIEGHTDNQGNAGANLALSRERANAVRAWLVSHGVDDKRLEAEGFGGTRPIYDNGTESGRYGNRRVDFKIIPVNDHGAVVTLGPKAVPPPTKAVPPRAPAPPLPPPWSRKRMHADASAPALEGPLADVMSAVEGNRLGDAIQRARELRRTDPGASLAVLALGHALEAEGDAQAAARAYGSLLDLWPGQPEAQRSAGERWEHLAERGGGAGVRALAIDAYRKAASERPDHPSVHHLLAYALLRAGDPAKAFDAMEAGARLTYAPRFLEAGRVLREDAAVIGAVWAHAAPERRDEIAARVSGLGVVMPAGPSLRFVLLWENDIADVDLVVEDGKGQTASATTARTLHSGGEFYADVQEGYGPECFAIAGPQARRAYPYKLAAHVHSRGSAGFVTGVVEVIDHDGAGGLSFDERPFLMMNGGSTVDLGVVTR